MAINKQRKALSNLRDMGGLECSDGKVIKANKLFRTSVLSPVDDADKEKIKNLNIDCVIDFRTKEEVKDLPDILPENVEYIFAPMYSEKKYKYIVVSKKQHVRVTFLIFGGYQKLYKNKYESYLEMPFAKEALSKLWEQMDQGKTIAFHCTEGKDRTGIAAAIIEYVFGRSKNEIMAEYIKSNEYRKSPKRENLRKVGASWNLIDAIYFCENTHEELLESSINKIIRLYGSVEKYLNDCLGISENRINKWKTFYLE